MNIIEIIVDNKKDKNEKIEELSNQFKFVR